MPSRYGVDKSLNSLEGMSAYENGGKGSGNFGHKGRPGEVGGSGDGMGVTVSDKIGQNQVWLCRNATVSCGLDDVGSDSFIGADPKYYYSQYGNVNEATIFDSHYPTKEDFAEAVRLQDRLDTLTWSRRDDSEWADGSESVGMIKERIRGNCDALLFAMASYYHGLEDDGRGRERANNITDSIRKDVSLLREKVSGLKPDRKRIANNTIKVAEQVMKMNGRTGNMKKHYAVTEMGEVRSFVMDDMARYHYVADKENR